jgi:hypothetical protein
MFCLRYVVFFSGNIPRLKEIFMKRIFFCVMIFFPVFVFAQENIHYVNAQAGLRVRNSPDINAERIGVLDNRTKVNVIREDTKTVTIDGITGKWVFVREKGIEGWVFSGYLLSTKQMLVGVWQTENYRNSRDFVFQVFRENGEWATLESGSRAEAEGTWDIVNGKLERVQKIFYNDGEPERKTVILENVFKILDEATLEITFSDSSREEFIRRLDMNHYLK